MWLKPKTSCCGILGRHKGVSKIFIDRQTKRRGNKNRRGVKKGYSVRSTAVLKQAIDKRSFIVEDLRYLEGGGGPKGTRSAGRKKSAKTIDTVVRRGRGNKKPWENSLKKTSRKLTGMTSLSLEGRLPAEEKNWNGRKLRIERESLADHSLTVCRGKKEKSLTWM